MNFSDIQHVTQDSREVQPGGYFVACLGEQIDGHDFISDALSRGAAGILEEGELFDLVRQKIAEFRPRVVGITGSVGKTTTKEASAAVLDQRFCVLKSPENVNTRRGLSIFVLNELRRKHEVLVVEIAMDRFGEIGEICQTILPNLAVVTSITETHLEKLGSLERIRETKAGILKSLPADGIAVLNHDDKNVVDIAKHAPGKTVWFGFDNASDVSASELKINLDGTAFVLSYVGQSTDLQIPWLGNGAVYAALAAAAVGSELGLTISEIQTALIELPPIPQRLNLLSTPRGFWILDDSYNASDVSTRNALQVLAELPASPADQPLAKRRVAVLGDMLELGQYEVEAHRIVGEAAAAVDILVVVGNLGKLIGESAQAYGLKTVYSVRSNQEAVAVLEREIGLRSGDVVLVKGSRGAKMEEVVEALSKKEAGFEL